jgi:hypothetical protein
VGAKGIQYVAKVATFLNFIPLPMLPIVFFQTAGGIGQYHVPAYPACRACRAQSSSGRLVIYDAES